VALLVLGGALASGHQNRVRDAVVLKVLGATRGRLIAAYALEYLLVGGATGVFGIAAGSAAAALILTRVMKSIIRMAPGTGFRGGRGRPRGDRTARADRHLRGARPETGPGAAQPLASLRCSHFRNGNRCPLFLKML